MPGANEVLSPDVSTASLSLPLSRTPGWLAVTSFRPEIHRDGSLFLYWNMACLAAVTRQYPDGKRVINIAHSWVDAAKVRRLGTIDPSGGIGAIFNAFKQRTLPLTVASEQPQSYFRRIRSAVYNAIELGRELYECGKVHSTKDVIVCNYNEYRRLQELAGTLETIERNSEFLLPLMGGKARPNITGHWKATAKIMGSHQQDQEESQLWEITETKDRLYARACGANEPSVEIADKRIEIAYKGMDAHGQHLFSWGERNPGAPTKIELVVKIDDTAISQHFFSVEVNTNAPHYPSALSVWKRADDPKPR